MKIFFKRLLAWIIFVEVVTIFICYLINIPFIGYLYNLIGLVAIATIVNLLSD